MARMWRNTAVVLILLVACAGARDRWMLPASAGEASGGSCAPPPTSAATMNTKMTQITGLGGFDAFRTARLGDGRWLSLTGDATRPGEPLPAYDNAAVIWDKKGQRRISVTDPNGDFFPRWPDGSEFWPGQQIVVGSTVYVTGSRQLVRGPFDWTPLGSYGAVVDVVPCGSVSFNRYFDTPSSGLDDTHVQWYAGLAADGTFAYPSGVLDRAELFHARDGGYTARVPVAQLPDRAAWQFWTGLGWSSDPAAAVDTIPAGAPQCAGGIGGTESGYTLHERPNGQWQITTKCGGTLARVLGRYTAANPWGPTWVWEDLISIGGLDHYLAGAANTVPTTGGNLLVQWSRSGSAGNTPQWAEVTP